MDYREVNLWDQWTVNRVITPSPTQYIVRPSRPPPTAPRAPVILPLNTAEVILPPRYKVSTPKHNNMPTHHKVPINRSLKMFLIIKVSRDLGVCPNIKVMCHNIKVILHRGTKVRQDTCLIPRIRGRSLLEGLTTRGVDPVTSSQPVATFFWVRATTRPAAVIPYRVMV